VLWNARRAVGDIPAILYFVGVMIVGKFVLLNLFLAILIRGFAEYRAEDKAVITRIERIRSLSHVGSPPDPHSRSHVHSPNGSSPNGSHGSRSSPNDFKTLTNADASRAMPANPMMMFSAEGGGGGGGGLSPNGSVTSSDASSPALSDLGAREHEYFDDDHRYCSYEAACVDEEKRMRRRG
jgi:hypothetical protein